MLALSRRWKQPERTYREAFANGNRLGLGDVQFVLVEDGLWVVNMVAQSGIGHGHMDRPPIRYEAVRECLAKVASRAKEQNAGIHMPRIGCGLAGGRWEAVEPIIQATLVETGVDTTVYDLGNPRVANQSGQRGAY